MNRGELIGGSVAIDAGRDVLNAGSIAANAGSAVVMAGRDFVQSADGRLSATADAVVAAGRDLTLQASANAAGGHSVSRIDAGGDLALVAGRDLTLQASQLTAGDNVVLQAGQDLRLEALADTRLFDSRRSSGSTTTHQVADIRAGGDAALSAGRDALLQGSHVDAEGALALVAGRDIDIQAVVDERSVESQGAVRRGSYQRSQFDQTVRGAELTAGSDIAIVGGRDVTLEAAYVGSDAGGVAIGAGRDLSLIAAEEQHNFEQTTQTKKSGFLSSKRTTTYDRVDETLAVGNTISGDTIQLTAGNDLAVTGSVVLADRDVRIAAGNNVTVESAQDTLYEAHSSSQRRSGFSGGFSGGVASIGYGKSSSSTQNTLAATTQVGSAVGSLDGNLTISAGNQLTIAASDLAAGQNLTLAAKDILLEARQDTIDRRGTQSSKSSGYSVGITYDPGAAYRSARDNATGSDPGSGSTMGEITRTADGMAAGSKAALTPLVVRGGSQRASGAWGDSTSDARVSQLAAGGNLTLLASDGSITSQGAQMSAEGDALLLASRNIVFDVAHNTESRGQDSARTGWSMDNSALLPVGMNRQQGDGAGYSDTITGTQLSVGGNAVLRTTEGDITLTGSNIVAEGNVDLHAAGNLSIRSGQDTAGNANRSDDKAIGTVVISDTERFSGYHTERYNGDGMQVSQVASTVGSLGGDVRMSAGGAYTQQASHVVAAGDVDITAATIDIITADDINSGSQQNKDFKFGVFARVNSPLIALVNNVDAARQSDGRLQAMQGMAAAANAYQTASAISSMAGGAGSGSLVSAEAGVGVATSQHQSQFNERLSQGSTISGGGNVSLTTTEGDLRITQGSLSAGNTLSLDSAKDLILEAGQSQVSDQSRGSNAGVEVGVGVSVGAQTGFYAYAQANVGSHRSNSDSTTYQNTQLSGQTINLRSGGDTTLRGATATADTINVATGGDLTIESLQDIAQSQSKDSNVGGRVQVSLGTAWSVSGNNGGNASGNASQSAASGNYAGVGQQSGLFAGDGGYHVNVGGAVNLVGGAIASTNSGNSELTAAELNFRDLQNTMAYDAASASLSGGFGSSKDVNGNWVKNADVGGGLPMHARGDDASLTRATLTEGRITIGGNTTTAADLGLNTDASKAHQQLQDLPDLQKMLAEQRAMSEAASTVMTTGQQVAGDLAAHAQIKAAEAANVYLSGLSPEQQAAFSNLSESEQQEYLLKNSAGYRDAHTESLQWSIGGSHNRTLQAVTLALLGSASGQAGSQVAANALAPYAAQLIGVNFDENHGSDPDAAAQLFSHALLGALLAEVNGANAAGGALAGAGGELAAGVLMRAFPDADKQSISALSQVIGALSGFMAGGSLSDAIVGGDVAKNAVENNKQLHWDKYLDKLSDCQNNASGSGCDAILRMGDNIQSALISPAQEGGVAYGVVVNKNRETGEVVSYTLIDGDSQPRIIMEQAEYNAFVGGGLGPWALAIAPSYALDLGSAGVHAFGGNYSDAISDFGDIFTNSDYWRDMGISIAMSAAAIKPVREIKLVDGAYHGGGFRINKIYYERLWGEGRPAPFLQAKEILNSSPKVYPDPRGMPGYYKFESPGL